MKRLLVLFFGFAAVWQANAETLVSPDGRLELKFSLTSDGRPNYSLEFKGQPVLKAGALGVRLKNDPGMESGFVVERVTAAHVDTTWETVWGEERTIRCCYNEQAVTLVQPTQKSRMMIVRFRLFNDGLGFRYEFPRQEPLTYFTVSDEVTQFALFGDHKAFWIPGDYDTNEYLYTTSRLSEVDATAGFAARDKPSDTHAGPRVVQTPLMLKTAEGVYLNIHEAAQVDYPALNLNVDGKNFVLSAHLVPAPDGDKAYLQTPCETPWRTIIVADNAPAILASRLILNLNEPCALKGTSWIKPMKYLGIWWEIHVGRGSWNYADISNIKLEGTDWKSLTPNGRHSANTVRTKRYIDFAAQHGFGGVLVEGWNVGWEDWMGHWKEEVFDFVTPYPDFDVAELQRYSAEKGVRLIMHHETSSSVSNYERRLDQAVAFMKTHGYEAVKTGYVGRIIPRGEHHDGQWMTAHYVRVAKKMAENQIMLDVHEPVRPTGLHRTYPNWLACEAARGNEYNAWSFGNPPEHETILPFTRLIGGPMDYTPGIFQTTLDYYDPAKKERVHTTLAKQLALYVTLYSPLQMAADLPENYERFMDAFQFIKDVAVDWDQTWVLEAEPGDFLTIARKVRDLDEWCIGAITDENARDAVVNLGFLPTGEFEAILYLDAKDADWEQRPMAYEIKKQKVTAKDVLTVRLAPGGGAAISIKPLR